MSNFDDPHIFIIQKEEKGVLFLECVKHDMPEFAVGIQTNENFKMVYIGIDEGYAKDLYAKLVSERKKNS